MEREEPTIVHQPNNEHRDLQASTRRVRSLAAFVEGCPVDESKWAAIRGTPTAYPDKYNREWRTINESACISEVFTAVVHQLL